MKRARRNGCPSGKIAYAGKGKAETFARHDGKYYGITMSTYQCEQCGAWHLTTARGIR